MFAKIIKLLLLFVGSIFKHNRKSKILFYHDIHEGEGYIAPDCGIVMGTQLDLFKKHIEVIKKEGYKIVPRITHEEGEVCIMLDDGFRGIYENKDFFYKNKICPTVFLAVDLIGKDGFLKPEEILELQEHGFVFECHGWTHTNLANKTEEQLVQELGGSKKYLSQLLNKEVDEICLPIGYFSTRLLTVLKQYDYNEVYSSIPGNYSEKIFEVLRPRNLCQFASPLEVKFFLRGGGEMIKERYKRLHHLE